MAQFARFVLFRAAMAVLTLILVSLIVFTLMEFVPGTCAERYLAFKNTQGSGISVADIEAERIRLGLNHPFLQRWATWLATSRALVGGRGPRSRASRSDSPSRSSMAA